MRYLKYKMYLTYFHFYNPKNYLYSRPVKGLQGYGLGYRFSFNGKEKDDEVQGGGNTYDYGFRIYNSRLGRFLSVDPLTQSYPFYTPYQFAGNKPIWMFDIDGMEGGFSNTIPTQGWAAAGIRQPYNNIEAKEWWNKFLMMYGEAYVSICLLAIPIEELAIAGVVKVFGNSASALRIIRSAGLLDKASDLNKAVSGAERGIQAVRTSKITNYEGLIKKAGKELEAYVKGKSNLSNYEGKLFEIKATESLKGVYKVNETMITKTGEKTVVDIFRNQNGINYITEVKSGKQGQQSWESFNKANGDQLNTYLKLAKENNSKVEYVFEGSVSNEVKTNLQNKGVTVTIIPKSE